MGYTGRSRILMYHAVCQSLGNPNKIFTSAELFEAQMRYLKRSRLRGVSVQELRWAQSKGNAKNLVGLTFDDGYENFLHTVVPILERYGFSATVFVLGGGLGGKNYWEFRDDPAPQIKLLGVDGLREVAARGMEVGAHSMTHPNLVGLKPDQLDEEVSGSRQILSEVLGKEVNGFCYPYGCIDKAAVEAVRRAGYAYACTIILRVEKNGYDLPRITVAQDTPLKFAVKLRIYPQYAALKKMYGRWVSPSVMWPMQS
jgi:peptidoglycan/xylan/chitin deacetylase (PgdA/CDA1 family)